MCLERVRCKNLAYIHFISWTEILITETNLCENQAMKMRIKLQKTACLIQSCMIFLSLSLHVSGSGCGRQMGIMTSLPQSWNITPLWTIRLTFNITNHTTAHTPEADSWCGVNILTVWIQTDPEKSYIADYVKMKTTLFFGQRRFWKPPNKYQT